MLAVGSPTVRQIRENHDAKKAIDYINQTAFAVCQKVKDKRLKVSRFYKREIEINN